MQQVAKAALMDEHEKEMTGSINVNITISVIVSGIGVID